MVGDPVIGIVIVTHGRLAEELIAATEHILVQADGGRIAALLDDFNGVA